MDRAVLFGLGVLLIVLAVGGYITPMSITLADTTVKLTIPQVVSFCDSGFGQFSQMLPQVVMVCSEYKNFMYGIYGSGLLGIILIIVGAAIGGKKESKEELEEEDDTPIQILKERYAKGEITKEEFEQMKKDLENS